MVFPSPSAGDCKSAPAIFAMFFPSAPVLKTKQKAEIGKEEILNTVRLKFDYPMKSRPTTQFTFRSVHDVLGSACEQRPADERAPFVEHVANPRQEHDTGNTRSK